MVYQMENERLIAKADTAGAELISLWDRSRERELIWQGNPAIWVQHSPLLFPVVGKVKNDEYRLGHSVYPMEKHGFAMGSRFSLFAQTESSVSLTLENSPRTMEGYPFAFLLEVTFSLQENRLEMLHTVRNPSLEHTLPFSIGAHPGLCCALGDQLIFEKEEAPEAWRLGKDMLLNPEPQAIPLRGRALSITKELFENDALIFQNLHSRALTLRSQGLGDLLRVDWYGAPVLGVWAKPGAPYVCVEPWYGIDDHAGTPEELTKKPRIVLLPPGEAFAFPVTLTVL